MFRVFLLFTYLIKITIQGSISIVNTESLQALPRSKKQVGDHCVLPDHPANGRLQILGEENEPYLPKSVVILNTIIDLTCTNGTATETGGFARAICYRGKWTPTLSKMGGCVRRCPSVETEWESTLFKRCNYKNQDVSCDNPVEGTTMQLVCTPADNRVGLTSLSTCQNGSWNTVIISGSDGLPCGPGQKNHLRRPY